jgi:Putative prokaryotic signal transducing protein
MGDLVTLETVGSEAEADLICGLLRGEGIDCIHRPTNFASASMDGLTSAGPREILVGAGDADRAREILQAQRG